MWLHEEVALGVTEGGVLEADGGAARPGRGVSGRREVDEAWGVQRGVGCRAGRGSGSTAGLRCNCFGGQVEWTHPRAGAGGTGLGSPHPTAPCPHLKLTVRAGPALPALSADAGEGVAAAHAGAPVHAGVGQAAVVLSCEGHRGGRGPVCLALDRWVSPPRPGPARGGLPDGGGGVGWTHPCSEGWGPPHRCCRCCPSSRGGRRSGRCHHCRSRCHRCCRCRHRTGTHLRAQAAQGRGPGRGQGRRARWAGTHVSGRSCPSSHPHTHSRSH